MREAILAIENAANAFILAPGGTYVSSHYEYRHAIETVVKRQWKNLIKRPAFRKMLTAADLPRSSVACRYPITVIEGKIHIHKPLTKSQAEVFLASAQSYLKTTTKYIKEYRNQP